MFLLFPQKCLSYYCNKQHISGEMRVGSHDITVFSLKANGRSEMIKRQAIFDKLKEKGLGIFLIKIIILVRLWITG